MRIILALFLLVNIAQAKFKWGYQHGQTSKSVALLHLNEGTGTTTKEEVWKENLSIYGDIIWIKGKLGKALDWAGTSLSYVNSEVFDDTTTFSVNDDLTISFWIKLNETYESSDGIWTIVCKGTNDSNYPIYKAYPYNYVVDLYKSDPPRMRFYIRKYWEADGTEVRSDNVVVELNDLDWHYVVVYKSKDNTEYGYYVDGKHISDTVLGGLTSEYNLWTSTMPFSLGEIDQTWNNVFDTTDHGTNFKLDEVIVETRIWSPAKIKQKYILQSGRIK